MSTSSAPPLAGAGAALRRRWPAGKWLATVAGIWIQCTSGSSYAFGIYSPLLKSSQSYDQSTLDAVATFKDIGANVGVISGLLYSAAPGPWVVLLAGATQGFVGYFFMWLSVVEVVPRPPVPLMCLYMLLAAHAQTFFNTADVVTAVENFPDHRGTVVGIMKGFLGLSGAILVQVYQTAFKGKQSSFILMLALLPTVIPLCLMFFVRNYSSVDVDEKRYLNRFSLLSVILAAYLMIIILLENLQLLDGTIQNVAFSILILFVVSPVGIAIGAQVKQSRALMSDGVPYHLEISANKVESAEGSSSSKPQYDHVAYHNLPLDADQDQSDNKKAALRGEDLSLFQAVRTVDFWLLFLAMAFAMGSGLATVNNISQIGGSLEYSDTERSTLVSLWSIWNFLGRFGGGYVSDYFLRLNGCPRPFFVAAALGAMTIGHLVIASALPGALFAGSILVGVCYGCQWSLMPTITSEIFGIRHMGTLFNTIAIASPIGSYIFSVRVIGYIYDRESSKKTCIGAHCFMLSFLIMAGATLVGSFIALFLFVRTRNFYRRVVFPRLR